MSEDNQSLKDIQALRAQRKSLDAEVYGARLELQKLRSALKRRAAGETARSADDARMQELRAKVAALEAQLREVNAGLNEIQDTIENAKRSNDIVIGLRRQIDAINAQIEEARRAIDALNRTRRSAMEPSVVRSRCACAR